MKTTTAETNYVSSSLYQHSSAASTSFEIHSAADEQQALMAKASFAPSPYVHFAKDTKKKKLGLAALVVLIFYEVSGGPFGIEDVVRAGVSYRLYLCTLLYGVLTSDWLIVVVVVVVVVVVTLL